MLGQPRGYTPELRPQAQAVPGLRQRPTTAKMPTVPRHSATKDSPPHPRMTQRMRISTYKSTTTASSHTRITAQLPTRQCICHTTCGGGLLAQQANCGRYTSGLTSHTTTSQDTDCMSSRARGRASKWAYPYDSGSFWSNPCNTTCSWSMTPPTGCHPTTHRTCAMTGSHPLPQTWSTHNTPNGCRMPRRVVMWNQTQARIATPRPMAWCAH